jgi:putative transposase
LTASGVSDVGISRVSTKAQGDSRHARGQDPAAETLYRDWDDFTTFFDFPAEHWIHVRTSNPVKSLFAGVRLRTNVARRIRIRDGTLHLVWKVAQRLERSWRLLNGGLTVMTLGDRFIDGIHVPRFEPEEVPAA